MFTLRRLLAAVTIGTAIAVPTDVELSASLLARQATSNNFAPVPLTAAQQNAYLPHAHFASAAYCLQSDVQAWKCGGDCTAVPKLVNVTVGGNNANRVPWYVGYYNDPTLDLTMTGINDGKGTIVVSHQGTAGAVLGFGLLDLTPTSLNPNIFGSGLTAARVTSGFAGYHAATQANILAAVKAKMAAFNTTKILVTGHSLGGALSVLSAVQFKNTLPAGTVVSSISFAHPRIGNKAFADFVGSHLNVIRHVNNRDDPVPVVPERNSSDLNQGFANILNRLVLDAFELTAFTGGNMYAGQQGEIHINADGTWYDCGTTVEDNQSTLCSTGLVRTVSIPSFLADFAPASPDMVAGPHGGPYDGVTMMQACTSLNPVLINNLN